MTAYNVETQVQSLGQKDILEKEMATHASILAWRTSRTEEAGGLHTARGVAKEANRTQRLNKIKDVVGWGRVSR